MLTDLERDILYDRLIKLGDMMGDGLHYEPDGKWIEKEYSKTLRLLGLLPKKDTIKIDKFMEQRTQNEKCSCGGQLKQTRKGSFIAECVVCGNKYRLGNKARKSK